MSRSTGDLSDLRVFTKREIAALLGISTDTLERLAARNLGPPRVKLTKQRWGYPAAGVRRWLADRGAEK